MDETNGELTQTTEVIHFDRETYISWESEKLPSNEWLSKGSKTLFVKEGNPRFELVYPQKFTISPVTKGTVKKHTIFYFKTSSHGFSRPSVFHIILPESFVPVSRSIKPKPESIIKRENRIAITWVFTESIQIAFYLAKVDKEKFHEFKTAGSPIRIRFDNETLKKIKSKLDEKLEDVSAKALAYYLKEQMG